LIGTILFNSLSHNLNFEEEADSSRFQVRKKQLFSVKKEEEQAKSLDCRLATLPWFEKWMAISQTSLYFDSMKVVWFNSWFEADASLHDRFHI